MKTASLLFMTMDRLEETKQTLNTNLYNHGCDNLEIELLWCDNGSKNQELIEFVKSKNPFYSRLNKRNEGCAKGFNQLYLRSRGEYIIMMGNDVLMPDGWLKEMINYADHVPNAGLIGVECAAGKPDISFQFGCYAHFLNPKHPKVFGVTLIKRRLIEEIGLFHDGFGVYGLEDSDFNLRATRAGFTSLYVPKMKSTHIGEDCGTTSEYRKMKDDSIALNDKIINELVLKYPTSNLKEPLPELRDPLE